MFAWHQLLGLLGTALIVGAYLLLQVGRLSPRRAPYSVANGLGAGLLIVSLCYDYNLSALLVECFWAAISILGLVRALRARTQPAGS